jgi:hypothetical protein
MKRRRMVCKAGPQLNDVPKELFFFHIFKYLDFKDLMTGARLVSKEFRDMVEELISNVFFLGTKDPRKFVNRFVWDINIESLYELAKYGVNERQGDGLASQVESKFKREQVVFIYHYDSENIYNFGLWNNKKFIFLYKRVYYFYEEDNYGHYGIGQEEYKKGVRVNIQKIVDRCTQAGVKRFLLRDGWCTHMPDLFTIYTRL